MNLSRFGKVTRVMNGVAAGQATNNGTGVDMKGFDAVTFILLVGDIAGAGTVTLKAQQGADNAADWQDLLGTAVAFAAGDDNKVAILEINCPRDRYVRPVVITAVGNGVIDGVIAIQTKAGTEPVTHDATTVVGSEFHQAPAEGTP